MRSRNRLARAWIVACGTVCAALTFNVGRAALTTPVAAQGQIKMTMTIGGGYVFAFSANHKNVTLGTLALPAGLPIHHYHEHPMFLRIRPNKGSADPAMTTYMQTQAGDFLPGWNLYGYEVRIKPDGGAPGVDALQVTQAAAPADPCATPAAGAVDNWAYVPDLLHLVGSAKVGDLTKTLATRIALGSGALKVAKLGKGCLSFTDGTTVQDRRLTADGQEGIVYTTTVAATFIDFDLHDPQTGVLVRRIRLKPDANGVLDLTLQTHRPVTAIPRDAMHFFHAYYGLITDMSNQPIPLAKHLIPMWEGPGEEGSPVTPGGECPPIGIDNP